MSDPDPQYNVFFSMVPYCAQKLLGRYCFGFNKENQ